MRRRASAGVTSGPAVGGASERTRGSVDALPSVSGGAFGGNPTSCGVEPTTSTIRTRATDEINTITPPTLARR